MKQKIRLTEEDLHNIVSESVKQALNELDPRTYASYANKRMKSAFSRLNSNDYEWFDDNYNKAKDGINRAIKSFNDRYSRNDGHNEYGMNPDSPFQEYDTLHRYKNDDGECYYRSYNPYNDTAFKYCEDDFDNGDFPDDFYDASEANRVAHEMANPEKGEYVKGKGWK